jgi:transcription elongation GreA/GreB family factor|tara:strand:- start:165 stop:623 length:459 start_codon:yes stop_codon:yes gene_type:complete
MLNSEFKLKVHKACEKVVLEKRKLLSQQLYSARLSANSETKSSAGDKHETGRALAQLEQENLAKQFSFLERLESDLSQLKADQISEKVEKGALVQTDKMTLFFGVALGELKVENKSVFAISSVSPIGKIALDKTMGDSFIVNGNTHNISHIT